MVIIQGTLVPFSACMDFENSQTFGADVRTHTHTHSHSRAEEAKCGGRERVVKGHRKLMAAAILHGISSDTLDRFVCVSQRSRGRT